MIGPETITEAEINAILNQFLFKGDTPLKRHKKTRNYLMFTLMLDAGLRISELLFLTINDLYLDNEPRHSLLIPDYATKNKTTRIIPLSSRIQNAIQYAHRGLWTEHDREINAFAFAGRNSTRPLTARQVENIVSTVSSKAIGRHIHPHVLRHTFASRLMRTCNARVVQALLGHKLLSSTQIYTHPNQDDMKKAIDSVEKGEQ